jgi:Uma2 family endonuclease
MPLALRARLSVSDYLALEETSRERHEFVAGEIHAMTGGTVRHNRIALNTAMALQRRFDGTPCQVFISDMKLHVAAMDAVYYPDVFVHCGALAGGDRLVDDATVVVEVMSDSTEAIDRREKLAAYRRLPSLRLYLLIAQSEQSVEAHARDAAGNWAATRYVKGEAVIDDAVGELPLAPLYAGTDLA